MSVDLKRLQQLAEAVGWKIKETTCGSTYPYQAKINGLIEYFTSITPIRARLEAEYRKLAIEVDRLWLLRYKVEDKVPRYEHSFGYDIFTAIADELAVKEPTMVERLKDYAERNPDHSEFRALALDALIDLYERKEK